MPALHLRQVAQHLHPSALGVHRRVHQGFFGIHFICRRLHRHQIIHVVGGIHPPVRRQLAAGTERHQHVVGDVLLLQAHLTGAPAIHVHAHQRHVVHLMNVHVGRAWNLRKAARNLLRDVVIGRRVLDGSNHLYVNRRGQAEVKNLAHDIGRLEEERQVGIFAGQLTPHVAHIIPGGAMLARFQRHQNFTVERAQGRAVAEREVKAAIRQADVIEDVRNLARWNNFADGILHLGKLLLRFLDARAARAAHMETNLPRVDLREEIGSDEGIKAHATDCHRRKQCQHQLAMRQRGVQHARIAVPHALEYIIETMVHFPDDPRVGNFILVFRAVPV